MTSDRIATLIARPGHLDPALAQALRDAWGGSEVRWLAPDQACEFRLDQAPGNHLSVWSDLQEQSVDLVIQPGAGRRKRLLIADMDSTMIGQECIDELAAVAGVGPRVAKITARAMNGELNFKSALIERVALLGGLDASVIDAVLRERITYTPGGRELVSTMHASGGYAALVSGGFTAFTARVAADLGFDTHQANTLEIRDGKLTGCVVEPILGRDAKVRALDSLCTELSITPGEVIAVGDGANDLGMLLRAGTGVALHAKPSVAAQAEIRVHHGDLTALLFLQGYASDEFA